MSGLFIGLYLDEDVDVLVAEMVRAHGFDALTTPAHPEGWSLHLQALDESRCWEERVSTDLGAVVFQRVFPDLLAALIEHDPERPEPLTAAYLDEVRRAGLTFLYRLATSTPRTGTSSLPRTRATTTTPSAAFGSGSGIAWTEGASSKRPEPSVPTSGLRGSGRGRARSPWLGARGVALFSGCSAWEPRSLASRLDGA